MNLDVTIDSSSTNVRIHFMCLLGCCACMSLANNKPSILPDCILKSRVFYLFNKCVEKNILLIL